MSRKKTTQVTFCFEATIDRLQQKVDEVKRYENEGFEVKTLYVNQYREASSPDREIYLRNPKVDEKRKPLLDFLSSKIDFDFMSNHWVYRD